MTHRNRHSAARDLDVASALKHRSDLPVLSEEDRCRLLREWTDANIRGDLDARRRVRAEILGQASTDDGTDRRDF